MRIEIRLVSEVGIQLDKASFIWNRPQERKIDPPIDAGGMQFYGYKIIPTLKPEPESNG